MMVLQTTRVGKQLSLLWCYFTNKILMTDKVKERKIINEKHFYGYRSSSIHSFQCDTGLHGQDGLQSQQHHFRDRHVGNHADRFQSSLHGR